MSRPNLPTGPRRLRSEKPVGPRGFSRWQAPFMRGYKLACCDCGLVHEMEFTVVEVQESRGASGFIGKKLPLAKYRVLMRARRAERWTAVNRARP